MTVVTCSGSVHDPPPPKTPWPRRSRRSRRCRRPRCCSSCARRRRRAAVPQSAVPPSRAGSRGTSALPPVRLRRSVRAVRSCRSRGARERAGRAGESKAPWRARRRARVVGVLVMIWACRLSRAHYRALLQDRPPVLAGDGPGLGGVAPRAPAYSLALGSAGRGCVLAAGLLGVWLLVDPRTPDLAAQAYRLGLYRTGGVRGVRRALVRGPRRCPATACCSRRWPRWWGCARSRAARCSSRSALFERIVLGVYGRGLRVRLGACMFAVAAVGDLWSGRLTFALGVTLRAGVRVCARPRTPARGGAARGGVRGGKPGRGRAAGAGRRSRMRSRSDGAADAAGAGRGPVALVLVPVRAAVRRAASSPIR